MNKTHTLTKINNVPNPLTTSGAIKVGDSCEGEPIRQPKEGEPMLFMKSDRKVRATTIVEEIQYYPEEKLIVFDTLNSVYQLQELC